MAKIASTLREAPGDEPRARAPVEDGTGRGLESAPGPMTMRTATTPARPRSPKRPLGPWGPLLVSGVLHGGAALAVVLFLASATREEPAQPCFQCKSIVDLHPQEEADAIGDVMPEDDPIDDLELEPLAEPTSEPTEAPSELPEFTDTEPQDLPVLEPHSVPLTAVKVRPRAATPAPTPAPAPTTRPVPTKTPVRPVSRPPTTRARPAPRLKLVSRPSLMRYYPEQARRDGLEGEALVEIVVDATGAVSKATLVRSSGHAILDRQAIRVLYAYRFEPGAGGRARVPVNFRLR